MTWSQLYTKIQSPTPADFDHYMDHPLWTALRTFVEDTYGVTPLVEYSCCCSAPGWNMKYRRRGKSICTLYPGLPEEGQFTCLVVIGPKEADQAEALLSTCDPYLQTLYQAAGGTGGSRWLMIAVTTERILEEVKALLQLRLKPPKKRT